MAIPAMSAPAESSVWIIGNVITKRRNNLSPTTTKMSAVVKIKVTRVRLCDVDLGIEPGDANINDASDLCAKITQKINDELDLCAKITRNIDDNGDEMIMDNEEENRSYNNFGD